MIMGIGIDAVEIKRFELWSTFSKKKLLKIFSEHEIDYCLEIPAKSAERFAARFASREAFFKAFCQMAPDHKIPFLSLCKLITIQFNPKGAPKLNVDWPSLCTESKIKIDYIPQICLSITHTEKQATSIVIVEKTN